MWQVVNLSRADADISEVVDYLYPRSPRGAEAWLTAYQNARKRLATIAETYPLADEYEGFEIEVRQLSFKTKRGRPYRLVFTIVGDEVRILRVRAPGQAPIDPDEI